MGFFGEVFKKKSYKDPVCGMGATDHISSMHNGVTYHFCSEHCQKEFEANPEKYITNG